MVDRLAQRETDLARLLNEIVLRRAPGLSPPERETAAGLVRDGRDEETIRLAFRLLHESEANESALAAARIYLARPGAIHRGSAALYIFEKAPAEFAQIDERLADDDDPDVAYVAARSIGTRDRRRGIALEIQLLGRAKHSLRESVVLDVVEEGDAGDLATLERLAKTVEGWSAYEEAREGLADRLAR